MLDAAASALISESAENEFVQKLSKTAPRYDWTRKRITKARALEIRMDAIKELMEKLNTLIARPLEYWEGYFKKLNPGSKAWKAQDMQPMFGMICNEEAAKELKKKPKKARRN